MRVFISVKIISILFLLACSLLYCISLAKIVKGNEPPKLLLISIDGLRYDFITPSRTPSLWSLAHQGVFFENGMKVQVHTVTASNHYSMVTGLYQESHGIIENSFWDPQLNEMYDVWNLRGNKTAYERSKLSYWYKGTTPIWQTNEEYWKGSNTRRSGSLFWPMGDCLINNKKIFKNMTWSDYGDGPVWRNEVDTLISWLTDEREPVNFLLYYNAQPDHMEHLTDVHGNEVSSVIKEIDETVGYLVERLKAVLLWDRINIILCSDHGHANIPHIDHFIVLPDYLDYSKIILNGRTLFPKPGTGVTAEEIYRNLTRAKFEKNYPMRIWRKEEFPSHYHYTNNHRIGPVIVFEELNYFLMFYDTPQKFLGVKSIPFGTHGWLNDYSEMRAFFIAHGPAFKSEFVVRGKNDIENIDMYPLMCIILGIDPLPNNGSLERIRFILRDGSNTADDMGKVEGPNIGQLSKKSGYLDRAIKLAPMISVSLVLAACGIYLWRNKRFLWWKRVNSGKNVRYHRLRNSLP